MGEPISDLLVQTGFPDQKAFERPAQSLSVIFYTFVLAFVARYGKWRTVNDAMADDSVQAIKHTSIASNYQPLPRIGQETAGRETVPPPT